MFLIDSTTKTIIAKTLAAPTASLSAVVHFNDISDYGANVAVGPTELTSDFNATYASIVPTVVDFQKRRVVYISIYNQNTEAHTVVVSLYNSSGPTTSPIFRGYLKQGWRAEYNVDNGWIVYNELGRPATNNGDSRVLSQSAPGAVLTDIFTAKRRTEISKIIIANRSNAAKTFRLALAPLGAAISNSQYIYYDYSIAKNETKEINGIIYLDNLDVIRVYGQDSNVSFSVTGKEL